MGRAVSPAHPVQQEEAGTVRALRSRGCSLLESRLPPQQPLPAHLISPRGLQEAGGLAQPPPFSLLEDQIHPCTWGRWPFGGSCALCYGWVPRGQRWLWGAFSLLALTSQAAVFTIKGFPFPLQPY